MDIAGLFARQKPLIGMVHAWALPGTPRYESGIEAIAQQAASEAQMLENAGFDALIVENMHDAPYVWGDLGPEITAAMTRIALEVRTAVKLPLGVQILSGGHNEALAAASCGAGDFVRCENFVFSHVADEGLISKAVAGEMLRYRKQIDAERVAIFADIKKKHASHALTADISVGEAAKAAAFFGADALIVSGKSTADPAEVSEVLEAKEASGLPVLVGSGLTPDNAGDMFEVADAVIVGSWYKQDGDWRRPLDPVRVRKLVDAVDRARSCA